MADVELLPLPEGEAIGWTQAWSYDQMRSYARANVAHATAARDAEIEALRAEVREAREFRDKMVNAIGSDQLRRFIEKHGEPVPLTIRMQQAEARAERLAEALRKVAQALDWYAHGRCRGFDDGPLLSTSEAIELAEHTLANALGHDDAAPAKENSND